VQDSASTRFKKRLRKLRESREWTQEQAAEACGIGYKLYQLYELGIKSNPGLVTLERIAGGFGLDVSEFLAPTLPKTARRRIRTAKGPPTRKTKPHRGMKQ
jgi:transcriptional regulator with XRE-family HTH domain